MKDILKAASGYFDKETRVLGGCILLGIVAMIASHKSGISHSIWFLGTLFGLTILMAPVVIFGKQRSALRQELEETKRARTADAEESRRKHSQFSAIIEDLRQKVENPRLRVITKAEYAQLLERWNASGEGRLLIFNIEMQSFETSEQMQATWGKLAEWTNIKEVILLLPHEKMRRWAEIVRREEDRFFAKKENRRFHVCEIPSTPKDTNGVVPTGIGFALYKKSLKDHRQDSLDDTALVFILSQPFSQLQPSFVSGDAAYWNYHHILAFNGDKEVITNCHYIWEQCIREAQKLDVAHVLILNRPLEEIPPRQLFQELAVDNRRQHELLLHFEPRQVRAYSPQRIFEGQGAGAFSVSYENGEFVEGHYSGIGANGSERKRAIVWIGGFTEKAGTKLSSLFEQKLKKESVAQFFYQVSPPVEYITVSRYQQDMQEVLGYVGRQGHVIQNNQIVLIARCINGLVATRVASQPGFQGMLAGVILVAPIFDLVECLNNYRKHRGQEDVTVEKCWRRVPNYHGRLWEDPKRRWLEYFDYDLSLTLFADVIRHRYDEFSLDAFVNSVGEISKHCPVYVLTNPDDPITGSARAIQALKDAAGGGGLIKAENFNYIPITSVHLPPSKIRKNVYPFTELSETRNALHEILLRLGIADTPDTSSDPPIPLFPKVQQG
jgi:hypothetical protein